MSPTRFFSPTDIHPELMAMCPAVGEAGKVVIWRSKRYYLSRQMCPEGKVYIAKLKRRIR